MNMHNNSALLTRIKAMEARPENANHEWVFDWFVTTKEKHNEDSKQTAIKDMQKAWAHFRSSCHRNNLEIQGYRRVKLSKIHGHPTFEVGMYVPKESIQIITEMLSSKFEKYDLQSATKQSITFPSAAQYIEKYFSKSHTPAQQEQLQSSAFGRVALFTNTHAIKL
ncbi:MAG: hypothetical protein WBA64_15785 [Marinomonas sp.]|uniref:hypothetical protein n=1 Tax=Marinomonas sp. TaxID=1904862 RepID=UPI003C77A1D0